MLVKCMCIRIYSNDSITPIRETIGMANAQYVSLKNSRCEIESSELNPTLRKKDYQCEKKNIL